ncbi:diguanylate cyclase [Neiella marina]|uniref:diguanylate cyclase n=1 Tax=Neiella holothuriorum TaxID=2870530 RepID=A0ABS7EHT1_9GAMM|nr:GGDEF domain-containing protein [Neiella holothuriorum]MBW8191899.1 diguanylate cyclase [Neiella holothuriorum]
MMLKYCLAQICSVRLPVRYFGLVFIVLSGVMSAGASAKQEPTGEPISANDATFSKWQQFTAAELLHQARLFKDTNQPLSAELARSALLSAEHNNEQSIVVQSHAFLASLAVKSNETEQGQYHFDQAFELYGRASETAKQITLSLDYANALVSAKYYQQAETIIDDVLPLVQEHGEPYLSALLLSAKGLSYHKQKRFDQAIVEFTKAVNYLTGKSDKIKQQLAVTFHNIAQSYKHLKDAPRAISFYQKALDVQTSRHDQPAIAKALKNIAMAENKRGGYLVALDHALHSLEIQKTLNNTANYAELLLLTGIIYRQIGDFEKSLSYIQKAETLYEQDDDIAHLAEASNQTGLIYSSLKQFDNSRSFYLHTIELPEDRVKPETRAAAYREIGVIDYEAGRYDVALVMASKSDAIYRSINATLKTAQVDLLLGKIQLAQQNNTLATHHFQQSLVLATQVNNIELQAQAFNYLGRIMISKDVEGGIELLKRGLKLAEQADLKIDQLMSYEWLKQAEKQRGNTIQALNFAEQEIAMALAIHQEREAAELMRAKAKLDSHKMELELTALQEKIKLDGLKLAQKNNEIEIVRQSSQIAELELTKERYFNLLLVVLLAMSLITALLIYRRFAAARVRHKELDFLAAHDPLTGCFNRRILFDRMNKDFEGLEYIQEYSIILADIDLFKDVNDTYGHSVGDIVLRGVADIMQVNTRKIDTVARFGGEEFCIILPGAGEKQAVRLAEDMRRKIETCRFNDVSVTCSFGVTSLQDHNQTPSDLIDKADYALYQSKKQGRNQVTVWHQAIEETG